MHEYQLFIILNIVKTFMIIQTYRHTDEHTDRQIDINTDRLIGRESMMH